MSNLSRSISSYSIKNDCKIKDICSPLVNLLEVPVFTYGFIEEDGRFGYLSNATEFTDYYFSQKLYLDNPYFSHPALFRSGHTLSPCTFDEETQKALTKKFQSDHLFLKIEAKPSRLEFFIFAHNSVDETGGNCYLPKLELFDQFGKHFKRKAKDLIGRMWADQFNIKKERGSDLFEAEAQVPLVNNDPKILSFLKKTTGLTPQERRCLELFKQGYSAQGTAAVMGLSRRTVEHYFENIKNKLDCYSKYDLLNY